MATISNLGERRVVDLMRREYPSRKNVLGLLDDVAAFPVPRDHLVVATTDVLHEATHFPRGTTAEDIGYATVAVNYSDLAAKGARPLGILTALTLPRSTREAFVRGFARGVKHALRVAGGEVLGGDTKQGSELVVTGTALGSVERENLMRRSGARPGDVIVATGRFGGPAATLRRLGRGRLDRGGRATLRPPLRTHLGVAWAEGRYVHAATDASDGLARAIELIAEASRLGARLFAAAVPREPGATLDEAVHGGGEYELVAAIPPAKVAAALNAAKRRRVPAKAVGFFTGAPGVHLVRDEGLEDLRNAGFEHFRSGRLRARRMPNP